MNHWKIIKIVTISSIIGFLLGEIFARGPQLLLYINNYLALPMGDGEAMILFLCSQLHIRPLAASIGAILVFSINIFQLRRSIVISRITIIGIVLILFVIAATMILASIALAMIELRFTLNDLTNLFFTPWCWGQ